MLSDKNNLQNIVPGSNTNSKKMGPEKGVFRKYRHVLSAKVEGT